MGTRQRIAIGVSLALISLAGADGASAAIEVGNDCVGNSAESNATMLQLSRAPGATLPLTVPTAGVVTKWKVNLFEVSGAYPEALKVFRPTAKATEFKVVGETGPQPVLGGSNTFDTRIPVQAGDRFGVYSSPTFGSGATSIYCTSTEETDVAGIFVGEAANESIHPYKEEKKRRVAVSAVVEPDVDGDGFGDETQDQCPQSAALHTACPPVTIHSLPLAGKGSVVLLVATSSQVPVTVAGTVKIDGPSEKGAGGSSLVRLKSAQQTVVPGKFGRFTLRFPSALKAKLKELSPKQSLALATVASATDVAGRVTKSAGKVKLKGQG